MVEEGSEEFRYLASMGTEASVNSNIHNHLIIQKNATQSALLEEYLHDTQINLGLINKYGSEQALEVHVKEFMLQHASMLGLANHNDIKLLQQLKSEEVERFLRLTKS